LFIDIKAQDGAAFYPAGVGREQQRQVNAFIRRDRIRWLDWDDQPTRFYLAWAEQLRLHLNRALFLGLFDYECHYSHYPRKAFYKKHLDAFQGNSSRRLSSVLYLNPAWQPCDGGELMMYAADGFTLMDKITPTFGKMVLFMAEEFPHEVLPTQCSRYSLTGWYRINESTGPGL